MASAVATAQHNLLALQTQLQSLQVENATLTKSLTLRENYLLQKEQQLRVLQQRLDDLEGGVAKWKDRYLQQLQANATTDSDASLMTDDWAPVALPPTRAGELPDADAMGALVDKLSSSDRDKLKKLLGAERTRTQVAPWEETFDDASPELERVLVHYLMPVLLETQRLAHARGEPRLSVQCLARQYRKPVTDVRIVCQSYSPDDETTGAADDGALRGTVSARGGTGSSRSTTSFVSSTDGSSRSTKTLVATDTAASTSLHRGSYGSESVTTAASTPPASASSFTTERLASDGDDHLFDCVDCDVAKRNGASAAAVPHGPREIHATKAVYVSRPLTPPSSGSSGVMETSRRSFRPTEAYNDDRSSGASSSSLTGAAPPTRDANKIKKIMGSVMKGLNRHKTTSSSSQPSMGRPPTPNTYASECDGDGDTDDASICDGCGRGLVTGVKWICRTCRLHKDQEYALCEKCYGQGLHGKENEDALFERIEEIVVAKCPKLAREQDLMKLLRVGICKANLKKYSFCLTWIADLLLCKATKDLRARALEISQISPQVRSEFVRILTDLLTKHRRDIELITEWQPVQNAGASAGTSSSDGSGMLQLDTLRIWVKDAVVDT